MGEDSAGRYDSADGKHMVGYLGYGVRFDWMIPQAAFGIIMMSSIWLFGLRIVTTIHNRKSLPREVCYVCLSYLGNLDN